MAVLCEAISVVIKGSAIEDKFPGGEDAFLKIVPNQTLCGDTELLRVGFMTPVDAKAFVEMLEDNGLVHLEDEEAVDLVVVDQLRGFMSSCSWAEVGRSPLDEDKKQVVTACYLKGSEIELLLCPDGWKYEESLSSSYGFVPSGHLDKSLVYLRTEDRMDVYFNILSGKEVYVGRTSDKELEEDN